VPWSYSPTRQISIFLARELSRHHRVGELPLHRCSSSSVRAQVREVAAPVHRGPRVLTVRTLSQVAPRRATANHTKLSALCTVPGQRSGPMLHASGPHRVRRSGSAMGPCSIHATHVADAYLLRPAAHMRAPHVHAKCCQLMKPHARAVPSLPSWSCL
jgi:hypothetical protein